MFDISLSLSWLVSTVCAVSFAQPARSIGARRCGRVDTLVLMRGVVFVPTSGVPTDGRGKSGFCCGVSLKRRITGKVRPQASLDEAKLASTCYGFRASLNLELAEDSTIVPFDRIQSEEESLANLTI